MQTNNIALSTALSLFCSAVFAQAHNLYTSEDHDLRNFSRIAISMPKPTSKIRLQNISSLEVIDARADTSSVGFMQKKYINTFFLVLPNGLKTKTNEFINDYFSFDKKDSNGNIVMVIKKLWLTDELSLLENEYVNNERKSVENKYTSGAKIKIEFYFSKGVDYYALYRYDTTLNNIGNIEKSGSAYLYDAFVGSLSKLINIVNHGINVENRRKLSWDQIEKHNAKDFDLPVLKDAALKKGVYSTFEEFKNNNPSQKNFEIQEDAISDLLYILESDGSKYIARNIWGYCDGKNAYVKSADNFFVLQRIENAFYIYGSKRIIKKHYTLVSPEKHISSSDSVSNNSTTDYTKSFFKLVLEPLQLDWDTGKLE
jgi:hypothetical protein